MLQKFLLSIVQFKDRHDNRLLLEPFSSPIADEKRKNCLTKFVIQDENKNSSTIADLCVVLKSREIKLQILLLLEIIGLNDLDWNFRDFEKKYKLKLKKRSLNLTKKGLVRRRSKKKTSEKDKGIERITTSLDYCEQLDLYLDRACILDILLSSETPNPDAIEASNGTIQEHKKNILDKKQRSLIGWVHKLCSYSIFQQKAQGTKHETKESPEKVNDSTNVSSPNTVETYNRLSTSQRASRSSIINSVPSSPALRRVDANLFSRKSIASPTPELLNSRTNSNLNEFLESETRSLKRPSQLGRTKSDLTMNHLQKRQFSVSDLSTTRVPNSSTITLKTPFSHSTINAYKTMNNSFRRVGKRKDINETIRLHERVDSEENVQVQATPAVKKRTVTPNKKAQLQSIIESPLNFKDDDTHEGRKNTSNITSTPTNKPPGK
ncbi:BEM_collapsed_G0019870.mRNA.1.CDS.1 [Saccharomyces cerevisiae]|nr:BEM_collapsed_G0019870.mRNA.1.CDS.1 [Saccharomyces cerevisiae]